MGDVHIAKGRIGMATTYDLSTIGKVATISMFSVTAKSSKSSEHFFFFSLESNELCCSSMDQYVLNTMQSLIPP
jgi:hypothetical protein